MRLLVTAGNTQAPIDAVRCITNIFTGRTGAAIAIRAAIRGHDVSLLTSHWETPGPIPQLTGETYRTFDELRTLMEARLRGGKYDGVIHSAAVSDYLVRSIHESPGGPGLDPTAGKLKSDAPELWLRLARAPKLIDAIRREWAFRGALVKFKLEVGVSDERLIEIAERSRQQSAADLMVANTFEHAKDWAFIGPLNGDYVRVTRADLPDRLIDAIEAV